MLHAISLAVALALSPAQAKPEALNVVRHQLANGLTVLIHQDRTVPTVAYHTLYKVGSRNERPGITGLAHLFEHMMFNGSERFAPKQLDAIIEESGGAANAFTTNDTTQYAQEVLSHALQKVIDIEADRMRALLLTEENLEQEREIVREERRANVDNEIVPSMFETLYHHAFVAHPYRWEVIGFMRDIETVSLADAKAFFRTYYAPNNAVLVLVGDVDPAKVMPQIEKAYGAIPSGDPPPPVPNAEPPQDGERVINFHRRAELPAILFGYKSVPLAHEDQPALDILFNILSSGQSSRMYQSLVYEKQISADVWASNQALIDPGLLVFYAQAQEGHTAEELDKAIREVILAVQREGVTERELSKAKNSLLAAHVDRLKTNGGIAEMLAYNEYARGDWRAAFSQPERWASVTAEDVKRVANRYLQQRQRTVVILHPEKEEGR
jgi:zinc protease